MPFKSKANAQGVRARWIAWRNGVLRSARFQSFAARCWLTRPVARARARATFDLVAGFVYSQTLAACIETGLLDLLALEPLTTDTIAARIDLPQAGAERLLRAAATLGLVERLGTRWALGSTGAALLGNSGIAEMVAHHRLLYADLADPVALLRQGGGGAVSRFWHYAEQPGGGTPAAVEAYSRLMAASQPLVAQQIFEVYRFARHRRILDVGGGEGRFIESLAARVAGPDLAVFDLAPVAARARARLAGLGARVTIHSGSFLADPLPPGYDLVTLVRVLHDHDDAPALALLRAVRAGLPAGGRLLIAEPMAGTPGAERAGDGYFGLYLQAMGAGRPRTPREISAMLRDAGFTQIRLLSTAMPLTCRVILAG